MLDNLLLTPENFKYTVAHFDAHLTVSGPYPMKKRIQPVNMRDIAKAAGVAQSTVSRALRNDAKISQEVKDRIEKIAKELNYRPNPFVSAFTSQVRGYRKEPAHATLGFLSALDKYEYRVYDPYYEGALKRAQELGFSTDLIKLHELDFSLSAANRVIKARSIAGLLILPVPAGFDLEGLDLEHVASATLDPSLKKPDIHRATPDYFQCMQLVLNTLEERGCKRICFCTWDDEMRRIGSRWMGSYLEWQAARQNRPITYCTGDDWDPKPYLRFIDREKPDAIVSNSTFYYNHLLSQGIPVPDQIAFASFGASDGNEALAGIDQNSELVASAGVDLVVSQMYRNESGIPDDPKSVSIRSHWVEGPSVPSRPKA